MNSKTTQGQPDTASPETEIQATAEVAAAEVVAPATKPKAPRKHKAALTLAELAEKYLAHMETDGKSPGTCSSYGAELKLAIKHLGGDVQVASITPEQVAEYFDSKPVTKLRSGKKKSQLSIDKTRRVLRLALCYAVERKLIATAPLPAPAGEQS
jgi:hypothetical protein